METHKTNNVRKNTAAISFKYELDGVGWSNARLKIEDTEVVFTRISYLCNPVSDLLAGLLGILEEWNLIATQGKKVKITNNDSVFTWEDEPGGYEWTLVRYGKNKLRVVIKNLYEDIPIYPKYGEIVLDKIVDFKVFATIIVREIDRLVKDFGLLGFRKNWVTSETWLQFPLSHFLELKHYLLYDKMLHIELEGKTKGWTLKEELQLLQAKV